MPSSVVAAMNYDRESATLTIIFVSGMVYAYKNVPEKIYQAMKIADSKGTYLNRHVKGNFDFEKLR
ncbi:MAG: KTSC domain-containing protein [Ferruginibacter sp.]